MLNIINGWNKFKNIIQIEKDKETIDKENLNISYNNFLLHYQDPKKAIKRDIENIKKCKISKYERDLIWIFFLGIIPFKNPSSWKRIISLEREKYSSLRNKYITKDIEDFIELKRINDTFKYDNYKEIIKKEEFHPDYGYRQGMGDICGVFLYVLYKDYYLKNGFEKDEITSLYSVIHSNNVYLEYDLYLLFNKFMNKGISEFFLYNTVKYKNNILGSKSIEEKINLSYDDIMNCEDSELKKRVYILYYDSFKKVEPDFYNLLNKDVYPELFLVRWYLCIFTREFKLEQVVYLWDMIIMYEFIESKLIEKSQIKTHFNFIDCIALSMLINCKPDIIKKQDVNEIMSSIMHYPNNISIEKICKLAIEIYIKLNPELNI